jgi:hypothetical protein
MQTLQKSYKPAFTAITSVRQACIAGWTKKANHQESLRPTESEKFARAGKMVESVSPSGDRAQRKKGNFMGIFASLSRS